MIANPVARRIATVTTVICLFLVVTLTSPVLVLVAALVDLGRRSTRSAPAVALRLLAFSWIYLLGEVWAVSALAITSPLPQRLKTNLTYRLQDRWAGWNLEALRKIFSLDISVEGQEALVPGPVIVLSRHVSMVDSLLPARFVARPTGMMLRYVLKRELLVDPALDIAGNRLANVFIDRSSGDISERTAIRDLASGLGPRDGILIYPEGTRFSPAKLKQIKARRSAEKDDLADVTERLQNVLPPRPGGTLALLDATEADVVVLTHRGLEGLGRARDVWKGSAVGSRVEVRLWRISRAEIPKTPAERVDWLYRVWVDVDQWVSSRDSG